MGFNTVAVIYNDHSSFLANDSGRYGPEIASAMRNWTMRDRDRLATHFSAGQIISQAHADYSQIVVVGRNTGAPLSECNDLDWMAQDQLAEALKRHGWTVRQPKKRRALAE